VQTEPVNVRIFPEIVESILRAEPGVQFVIVTGDLVNGNNDDRAHLDQYAIWREITKPWYASGMTGAKVYTIPGNHDLRNPQRYGEYWASIFPENPENGPDGEKKMTYSFDAGPCHLVCLKTTIPGVGCKVNLDWVAKDLAESQAPVKLVFGHAPAFPALLHVGSSLDQFPEERDRFWEILADNGVQAYFCGHEHMSQRWEYKDVQQITLGGGGGFSLYFHYLIVDASETDVTVSVMSPTGQLYDQYSLTQTKGVSKEDRSASDRTLVDEIPCVSVLGVVGVMLGAGFFMVGRVD
jgi:3',5'-cyclic AMP phosphodiesterase CpdA